LRLCQSWRVSAPRLLLVPSFTELEWGIRRALEEWAEVATFDMPGVGETPLPEHLDLEEEDMSGLLAQWRQAGAKHALEEVDRLGWDRFFVVTDSHGPPTAVRIASQGPQAVLGLAIGHASLSHSTEGERAPMRGAVWEAMAQLASQGSEPFVRYGIAQMTRGGISEEVAQQMVDRFPDAALVTLIVKALGKDPEPIGDQLAALDLPMLLAKHEGCLGRTDEGYEDIVAAFPRAETVICPETCASSPTFAKSLREFCRRKLGSGASVA
jgi:pimeloyl-ACP methyl ester carboxylesterase